MNLSKAIEDTGSRTIAGHVTPTVTTSNGTTLIYKLKVGPDTHCKLKETLPIGKIETPY